MKNTYKITLVILLLLNLILILNLINCSDCISCNLFCLSCFNNDNLIQTCVLLATISGFVITIKSFKKANDIKKTEFYIDFKTRFKSRKSFNKIRNLLLKSTKDKSQIKELSKIERIDYAGFLEEIYILMEKKLISKNDVYYSFGQYILECNHSTEFWNDLDKGHPLWKNFRLLVIEIEKIEKNHS